MFLAGVTAHVVLSSISEGVTSEAQMHLSRAGIALGFPGLCIHQLPCYDNIECARIEPNATARAGTKPWPGWNNFELVHPVAVQFMEHMEEGDFSTFCANRSWTRVKHKLSGSKKRKNLP